MKKANLNHLKKRIGILGGGAAGFFAAISCAEELKRYGIPCDITIFEGHKSFLRKVKISGGGRCNVTHHEFNPSIFCESYPRGRRELRSPMSVFQAQDTVKWFEDRGVRLVTEEDGRMFPESHQSQSIIDCFMEECQKLNIKCLSGKRIQRVEYRDQTFHLMAHDQRFQVEALLLATGSDKTGYAFAQSLGHTITDLAPSLFTFKIDDPLLKGLAGTSFQNIELKTLGLGKKVHKTNGPALITHHGLSGPAILELSARAAREMKRAHYRCQLVINWSPFHNQQQVDDDLRAHRKREARTLVKNKAPAYLTKRFWQRLLDLTGVDHSKSYSDLSKTEFNRLVQGLYHYPCTMSGQNRFKEEFVECGGVSLREVSFQTMESKIVPKLFFAGELLDVDGVTGGYNFQNAWTTGFIAGKNLALSSLE